MENEDLTQFDSTSTEVEEQLAAAQAPESSEGRHYRRDEYRWDRSQEKYWDLITYQLVGAIVVDGSVPILARTPGPRRANGNEGPAILPSVEIRQIEQNLTVHSSTWWPGKPQIIEGMMADATGFYEEPGVKIFNTYRAPIIKKTTQNPYPWIEHIKRLWPQKVEHEYFFDYCAHMVQQPGEKCNAGIVLSGAQGVGKDAALIPLKVAVGFANSMNISPDTLFKDFNEYVRSVLLIVDEARSQSDEHKATTMYNVLKPLCAAPPEVLRMNLKKLHPVWIRNCCRLIITTNEIDSMFVPKDDRRLFIMHTEITRQEVIEDISGYWEWLKEDGGYAVADWLRRRDIRNFDASKEPPKTPKHTELCESWGHDPDSAIGLAFLSLQNESGELPEVMTAATLKRAVDKVKFDDDRRALTAALGPRTIARTMTRAGYVSMSNPQHPQGFWRQRRDVGGKMYEETLKVAFRRADVPLRRALPQIAALVADALAEKIRASEIRAVRPATNDKEPTF